MKINGKDELSEKNEFDFKLSFPPLGHSEHHFNKYPNHPWLIDEKEIVEWVRKNSLFDIKNIKVNEDKTISIINDDYNLKSKIRKQVLSVPVQFRNINRLYINSESEDELISLNSFVGFPYFAKEVTLKNINVKSLKGFSKNITDVLNLNNIGINDFNILSEMNVVPKKINLYSNPIKSWNGFRECEEITWFKNITDVNDFNQLLNAPKVLKNIYIDKNCEISRGFYINKELVKNKSGLLEVRIKMDWLRSLQKVTDDTKELHKKINDSILESNEKNIKKKI